MVKVYIVVMDYSNGTVTQYSHEFLEGYSDADIVTWLELNVPDYMESTCSYMYMEEPIPMQFMGD